MKGRAGRQLLAFRDVVNETVGDALSDMLAVEAVLAALNWTEKEWLGMYNDYPNKLMKVSVKDRSVIQTTDAERRCTSPELLQPKIDELVAKYGGKEGGARSFVRPSGTEDVVRVYGEAPDRARMEALATEVAQAVFDLAHGTGERPA